MSSADFCMKMKAFLICRITINVYEFIIQDRIVQCSEDFEAPWNLPRWGNFLNEVSYITAIQHWSKVKILNFFKILHKIDHIYFVWRVLLKLLILFFQISNILLVVNSSANFVYYCLLAESFRKQIANLILKYCKCLRQYLNRYQQNSQTSPYPGPKIQLNEMPCRQSLLDGTLEVAVTNQDMNDMAEDESNPVLQVIVQAEPEPKNIQRNNV